MKRSRPWYREPWPWLLMLGPAMVVVAGFVTLWLAIASNDGLVADDYYKQGLAINQTLARSDRAKALGLSAILRVDAERIRAILKSVEGGDFPAGLRITFSHPTRGGLDKLVKLERSSGGYEGATPVLGGGRWQVILEDDRLTWRLAGAIRIPDEAQIELHESP